MKRTQFITIIAILSIIVSCNNGGTTNRKATEKTPTISNIYVGDKYGFIDDDGNIIIEPQFDDAYTIFSEGVCYVELETKKGLINKDGQFILEVADSVQHISNFVNGFSRLNCGKEKVGIISIDGDYIIQPKHYNVTVNADADSLYFLIEGSKDDKDWFMADSRGKIIGQPCDSILSGFNNEMCAFKSSGKWGYMDKSGTIIIEPQYDMAKIFTENNIARVRKGTETFYIDKIGRKILPHCQPITGISHNRGFAIVNGEKQLIDKHGNIVKKIDADEVYSFGDDYLANIVKDGVVTKIDTMGNIVLATNYSVVGEFINGIAVALKDKKVGYIDITGKEIIPCKYEGRLSITETIESNVRELYNYKDGNYVYTIYNLQGKQIWQDMPKSVKSIPWNQTKENFIEYFDSHLANLDPIEGIYYVTYKNYYQDRDNLNNIGLNSSKSEFYAIATPDGGENYYAYCIDDAWARWVNKFVKIGDSNNYAITKIEKDNDYSSEGRVTIEDPSQFEFRLETGKNSGYNFFVTYEFIKDYPPIAEYEKVKKAEWTGSGFAIAEGYIVTNYHVTSGANTILVRGISGDFNERYRGYVVASDKEHDLSIIKIVDKDFNSFGELPYSIGNTSVDVGDNIFVLGYPMTTTMGEEIKLTDGIISSATGYKGDESLYQISAAVQPGNSGGPLFNSDGTVVGIICGKHSTAENANYAIKTSYLHRLVNSSDIGIDITQSKNIKADKLSTRVEKVKNFVYLIECNSR